MQRPPISVRVLASVVPDNVLVDWVLKPAQLQHHHRSSMKMTFGDRTLLAITCILAGYQVVAGINELDRVPIIAYTIGFGILLVASLLMIILGFEVMDSSIVVVLSTAIPLSLSLGLVWEHLASYRTLYLVFSIIGFVAICLTRSISIHNKLSTITLAIVHGIAGIIIFLLPGLLAANGTMNRAFVLVGLGGALIGLGGLMLSFLKTGRLILPREKILKVFPGLFMLMTACFVAGFRFG